MRKKRFHGGQPRFSAACSIAGIEIGERGGDVHVEDRIEIEADHQHDAREAPLGEPVEGRGGIHQAELDQRGVERAVHAEHLFHSHRTDEGRQDHRRQHQHAERAACR